MQGRNLQGTDMVKDPDTRGTYMAKYPDTRGIHATGLRALDGGPRPPAASSRTLSRAADRALDGGPRPPAASLRELFHVLRIPLLREVQFRLALETQSVRVRRQVHKGTADSWPGGYEHPQAGPYQRMMRDHKMLGVFEARIVERFEEGTVGVFGDACRTLAAHHLHPRHDDIDDYPNTNVTNSRL